MMASIVCCRRNPEMIPKIHFPVEVLLNVFEYVFECPLKITQFNRLGFFTGRSILIGQLEAYKGTLWFYQRAEKANADGLLSAVRATNHVMELTQHVSDQYQLNEKSEIYTLWHSRLGDPVISELSESDNKFEA